MDEFAGYGLQQLYQKRDELEELLVRGLDEMRRSGIKLAENEAEYRKRLAVEILQQRAAGVPVTVIGDICRGLDYIAGLKQARDSSEAVYSAAKESINVNKLRLKTVEAEIQRIWTSGGYGGYQQ